MSDLDSSLLLSSSGCSSREAVLLQHPPLDQVADQDVVDDGDDDDGDGKDYDESVLPQHYPLHQGLALDGHLIAPASPPLQVLQLILLIVFQCNYNTYSHLKQFSVTVQ